MLKYRHTSVDDTQKIGEWVAADPSHKDIFKPEDFILLPDANGNIPKGIQCIEVQDEKGTVFYLRFRNALIVETQFAPTSDVRDFGYLRQQIRVSKALKEALAYFSVASKNLGYYAMFFNSVSESLINFFEKLGFTRLTDYFKADL
jgi:hypothetical protein